MSYENVRIVTLRWVELKGGGVWADRTFLMGLKSRESVDQSGSRAE